MVLRKLTGVFSIALVIGAASFAVAGVPDLFLSTATTGAGSPVMYNLPNGLGSTFAQARALGNPNPVNATITLTVLDGGSVPVANFSAADMWLEKAVVAGTGNFIACNGGTTADANTNASGVTTWVAPLRAGGWSTANTVVVINGQPLTSSAGLNLRHNSADINGDGTVNVADIPYFAADFGTTTFKSDLIFDGIVNVADVPRLASGYGAVCP